MKKRAPMFAVLLLLSACRKDEVNLCHVGCKPYTTEEPTLNAFTEIRAGKVVDDCLQLIVNYGGCSPDHDFDLYWDGGLSPSEPGTVTMVLHQLTEGAMCDAYLTDTLLFDLSLLAEAAPGLDSITVTTGEFSSITLSLDN